MASFTAASVVLSAIGSVGFTKPVVIPGGLYYATGFQGFGNGYALGKTESKKQVNIVLAMYMHFFGYAY